MLTPRDNLLAVLRHQQPAWIPIIGRADPYSQPSREGMPPALAEALGTVAWGDESSVKLSRFFGLDVFDFFPARVLIHESNPRVTLTQTQAGDNQVTTWRTPRGDLRQVTGYSPETRLHYTVEHAVKDAADLARLACLFESAEYSLDPQGVERLTQRQTLIGEDDGLIMFPMDGTPLGQMLRFHAGVETMAYLWADARRELHELFAVMEAAALRKIELLGTVAGDAIVGMDDTSTTTQSPDMFEAFCLGYTDRAADAAHAGGKCYFHHSCGLIRDLLPLYRQTRMDAVHAFQVPPIGNVTVAEGRRLLGSKITIIASINQLWGSMENWETVRRSLHEMIEGAVPGDHFILNLAADPKNTVAIMQRVLDEIRSIRTVQVGRPVG